MVQRKRKNGRSEGEQTGVRHKQEEEDGKEDMLVNPEPPPPRVSNLVQTRSGEKALGKVYIYFTFFFFFLGTTVTLKME